MRAEDVLPDNVNEARFGGVTIRKGSVAAFLANAAALDNPAITDEARATALRDIEEGLPALRAVGLFDILQVRNPALRSLVEGPSETAQGPLPTAAALTDPPDLPNLDALYAPPSEMIQKAVFDRLLDFHEAYLRAATFFCLATGSSNGLDASPRGGPPGFVHVLDAHTIAFADWPGNNRIESMRNLERDDRVGMLFLFPGLEIFLRINGRARVSTDPALLAEVGEGQRTPKTAIVVALDEVLVHCGKAVNRARLWSDGARLGRDALPTVGRMMASMARQADAAQSVPEAQISQIDAHYDEVVRNDLY